VSSLLGLLGVLLFGSDAGAKTVHVSRREGSRGEPTQRGECFHRNLRIAEVTKLDVSIEDGKAKAYRARVNVSFKYMKEEE
jgi:hypothetical protein